LPLKGYWLLVIGCWLRERGEINWICTLFYAFKRLLVIGYWLLVIGYWLLVVGCWLSVVGGERDVRNKLDLHIILCLMPYALCLMPHASCLMPCAFCLLCLMPSTF
jgi:hypothetical protein